MASKPVVHHSNEGPVCKKCEEKLTLVHSELADWFRTVRFRFMDMHVAEGWRGEKAQNEAHAEGKSDKPWPLSKHNKSDDEGNPCSLAVDLFQLASNGMACWPWSKYREVADTIKASAYHIHWGGWWRSLKSGVKDGPHFELLSGPTQEVPDPDPAA